MAGVSANVSAGVPRNWWTALDERNSGGYFDRPGKEQEWELKAHAQSHTSQRQKLYDLALRFVERVQKQITFVPGQLDFGPRFFDPLVEVEEELEEDDE